MSDSPSRPISQATRTRRRLALKLALPSAMLTLAAALATVAFASGGSLTLGSASNSQLGRRIAVDAQGRTVYALSPETSHHLLCKTTECLKVWRPLTVASSKTKLAAGPGVHGHLGTLRRSGGALQVTLGGLPLYRYSGDRAQGEANGQGLRSFGGTWHVISASASSSPAGPTPPTPTRPSTPTTPSSPTTPSTPTTPSSTPGYAPGYGY